MSKWRYGCGKRFTVTIPRGYGYREVSVECGSTAADGGVNQCETCCCDPALRPPPTPDYGDAEHDFDGE